MVWYYCGMRTIERNIVGAFIFSSDNKVLLGQSITGGVYPDQWVVPGGGIEDGETNLEAVIREVQEEVGIDISNAQIEEIEGVSAGQSEKTLRDSGERVLVDMTFYDYKVTLPSDSNDITLHFDDDFSKAEWFEASELSKIKIGSATRKTLIKLGFISE